MQAIEVTYLPRTGGRSSRMKASCERGSITIPYPYGLDARDRPKAAADALVRKFVEEDKARGVPSVENTWGKPFVAGQTKNNDHVFVYLDGPALEVIEWARAVVARWENKSLASAVLELSMALADFDTACRPKLEDTDGNG